MAELTMIQAINQALRDEMAADEDVVVLGEDVGVNGGIFRVTDGLLDEFGEDRVFDTPLAESGIVGSSIGMAIYGMKPVCELQFSGFSYFAFHQIEAHAARMRKRSQGRFTVPMVVRMPYGAGVHALEHHSESRETYWIHTPGLKVITPSSTRAAYDLLRLAIRDEDPVIFCEPKALYRSKEEIPEDPTIDRSIGAAEVPRQGSDLTIVTFGAMLPRVLEAAERLAGEHGAEAEVVDLQTVSPMDYETVRSSFESTGRAMVVHEAHRTLGLGAEIVARINETSLLHLEAPVRRVTGWDVQVPLFAREQAYLPSVDQILRGARETVEF